MMMNNLVSIIMPVYNSEAFLKTAIQSVISQEYDNWELIIINDGSLDSSEAICKRFVEHDKRIRLFSKPNGGVSSARNFGLEKANGEFVCFLDSDDYFDRKYLSTMISNIDGSDLVVCSIKSPNSSQTFIVTDAPKTYQNIYETADSFLSLFRSGFYNSPCNKMYRREKIKECFPNNLSLGEDLLFNCGYFMDISKITVIPDVLYYYRLSNDDSLSNRIDSMFVYSWKRIYQSFDDLFHDENINKTVCRDFIETLNYNVLRFASNNKRTKINDLVKSIIDTKFLDYSWKKAGKMGLKNKITFNAIAKRRIFLLRFLGLAFRVFK